MKNKKTPLEDIYYHTIGKVLRHFHKHRIQGRIFFSSLGVALQLSAITYVFILAIAHGFEILDYLNQLLNKCL